MNHLFASGGGKFSFSQNSLMNLVTQLAVSGMAVLALPFIVHGLGDERFGLLSVCWLMLGYVGFLDLGIGQAATNLLAGRVSDGRMEEAGRILRTSLLLGIAMSVLLVVLFEVLLKLGLAAFLNLSESVVAEATVSFHIFALGIPPVLLMGVLKSVPFTLNRFDIVNLFQTAGAVLQWLGSIAAIALGGSLVHVIALFVATRYLMAALLYLYVRRVFPGNGGIRSPAGESYVRVLLAFGGWITIAQVVGPILLVLERLIISRTSSPEWITYFAVPQDTLLKLIVIPLSLASTLYPLISARWHTPEGPSVSRRIYLDSVRYTYYILLPAIFLAVVFRHEILRVWLGEVFSVRSGDVFGIVALGVLFHALAQLPSSVLLGSGRPWVPARLLLVEALPYLALCVALTAGWGVIGTACAWLLRIVVETAYLFMKAGSLWEGIGTSTVYSYLWKGAALLAGCGLPVLAIRSLGLGDPASMFLMIAFLLAYSSCLWFFVFDRDDRGRFRGIFRVAGV